MSYRLFLDDERFPPDDGQDWVIIRTSAEAIVYAQENGFPYFISFDHDLGGDDTSMAFINWLIAHCLDLIDGGVEKKSIEFPDYTVHSQNPVGAMNIKARLAGFKDFLEEDNGVD